jgi:uncharacterized cofD-like protein
MKIVTVGGGTGGSVVDAGLSKKYSDLTAVVTSFDNGGSSGILRREFGMLPQGDMRRRIFAQKNIENDILEQIYNFRFGEEKNGMNESSLENHSVGNLMLLAATWIWGEKEGIEKVCELFKIKGKVLPVTYDYAELCAKLTDGQRIFGEDIVGQTIIDKRDKQDERKIEKVYLNRLTKLNQDVVKEILAAKYIVLCPGDFYTSLIPNFLVPGFTNAIRKAKKNGSKIIFVCNIMTKASETKGFKLSDFVRDVEKYLDNKVDYILYNKNQIDSKLLRKYKKQERAELVVNDLQSKDLRVREVNLLKQNGHIRHDSELFLKAFEQIVNEDIKEKLYIFDLDDTLIPTSKYREEYINNNYKNLRINSLAKKVLGKIGKKNLILLTHDKYGNQKEKIKHLKIEKNFSEIKVVYKNEDKKVFIEKVKRENREKNIFVVGDKHDSEIKFAKQLGLRTICVAIVPGRHINKSLHSTCDLVIEKEEDFSCVV